MKKQDIYANVRLFQDWNNLTIDERISKIKDVYKLSQKSIDVLSKIDEGSQLNCHQKTLDSLYIYHHCLTRIRVALTPCKNDKFEISKDFLYRLQFCEDLKNETLLKR